MVTKYFSDSGDRKIERKESMPYAFQVFLGLMGFMLFMVCIPGIPFIWGYGVYYIFHYPHYTEAPEYFDARLVLCFLCAALWTGIYGTTIACIMKLLDGPAKD